MRAGPPATEKATHSARCSSRAGLAVDLVQECRPAAPMMPVEPWS